MERSLAPAAHASLTMSGTRPLKTCASLAALALAFGLSAAGCTPITHTHGYTPRATELEEIRAGQDTRETVQRKLGRPSTIGSFDEDDWYYISMKTEALAFFEPEVVDQQVVTVSFDSTGVVENVNRYGLEDGQVVDLVTRTTPTSGRKLTILQQIFGNLGRFDTQDGGGPIGSSPF